ncbi:MAG: DUF58 domain-containing protein [candidate division WS1 bacterium]|nr:DUF58 domain-containing protein [candidate division WS1 bacterium]
MSRGIKIQLLTWGTVFILMVGLILHIQQLLFVAATLALLAPISYLFSRTTLRGLQVNRGLPPHMTAGETHEVALTVVNASSRSRPAFWLEDVLPEGLSRADDGADLVLDLAPRESRQIRYPLTAQHRGPFRLGPLRFFASDVLALHHFEKTLNTRDELLVYPRIVPLPDLWPRSPADRASPRRTRRRPGGIDPRGTREYAPGDDLRHIHWKVSARRGRLMIVEREQAEGLRATVLLDLNSTVHTGQGRESTLEYGVTLAASLIAQALDEGGSAGLMAKGEHEYSVPPESNPAQRWRLLEALARVETTRDAPVPQLALAMVKNLPRGSAVAIITPQTGPEMISLAGLLASRGFRVIWFLLVAPTFELHQPQDLREERYQQLAADLRRRGQSAYLIRAGGGVEASLGRGLREAG